MQQPSTPDTANDNIPQLASKAFRGAYIRALQARGHVLIARNGQLGQIKADGSFTAMRTLKVPTKVTVGAVRIRSRGAKDE